MSRRRTAITIGLLAAAAAGVAVQWKAFAGGAGYWMRQARRPAPCPYSLAWLLELPRPGLNLRRLLSILEPLPGERLLEVGPGTGVYTLPVARAVQPDGCIDALDVQQEMLDALTAKAAEEGVDGIRTAQGDVPPLPYPDATFDGAYLVTVLHEISDKQRALQELRRVVKPGGRIVIGEMAPLPTSHFLHWPALVQAAEAAGMRCERRLGSRLLYYARLVSMA